MKGKIRTTRLLGLVFLLFSVMAITMPDIAEARRGGSFGGFRSFRSRPSLVQKGRGKSFSNQSPKSRTSFGGTRMTSQQAKAKYGTPRKVQQTVGKNSSGASQVYNMHHYGGYSSGLMTGYMMGHTSALWLFPFHPAFYYSQPHYVENPDGTIDVYPPTLSFGRILIGLILLFAIARFVFRIIAKASKSRQAKQSSFL